MLVELLPSNKRHKQLIKEHGKHWQVLESRSVQCFGGLVGVLIEAGDHVRWVKPEDIKGVDHV